MPIKIERDWFFPKSTDGNLSLSTQEERINQALASMQPGDWLEVDGIKCCSRDEILAVLRNPHVQVPMNNPDPQATSIVCPNCGGINTNKQNCEYCGSMLIRFVAKNIAVDKKIFGADVIKNEEIRESLRKNLDLQKYLSSSEIVVTQTNRKDRKKTSTFSYAPLIIGGNITDAFRYFYTESTKSTAFMSFADADIPPYSEPRLLIFLPVFLDEHLLEKATYSELFTKINIPFHKVNGEVFKTRDTNLWYIDMGQDYENAAKIVVDFWRAFDGVAQDQIDISTETLSEEQQRSYRPDFAKNKKVDRLGCSVALLPILGIGAGVAAGVVKLITHLLV